MRSNLCLHVVKGIFHNSIHDALTKSLEFSDAENKIKGFLVNETSDQSKQTEDHISSVIVVCGSTFLMSEARKTLGITDSAEDNLSMNTPSQLEKILR